MRILGVGDGGRLIGFGFCEKCVVMRVGWEIVERVRVIIFDWEIRKVMGEVMVVFGICGNMVIKVLWGGMWVLRV